jgi:DNA repair protein RadC
MADDGHQLHLPFPGTERRRRSPIIPARVRVELVRESEPLEPVALSGAASVYAFLREEVATWDRERFVSLILDNKHRLIGVEEVSVGSLTSTVVHPREVFKAIILANAAAFIVAHNHPSGDPTPSREDIEITRRLREAAEIFGIRCLDHIVIGHGRYVSFVDDGYW